QTYTGATTLAATVNLTAALVNFQSTVDGGANGLTVTGNLDLDGAITNVTNLSVTGTSDLGADVTTTGTQTYTGLVTLSGGARNLTGTTVTLSAGATGTND